MSTCPACQTSLPDDARFCPNCGETLTGKAPAESPSDFAEASAMQTVSGLETVGPGEHNNMPGVPAHDLDPYRNALKRGQVVADKYRIERPHGAGGMGIVYKAVEIVTDTTVALKVISQRHVGNDRAVQRLIDEGKTTRTIAHPNVVRMHDIGVWQGAPYIAMEFIDGKPLHIWRNEKMTRNEPVPSKVAGQIIKEVLNGLEAAHAAGVIHRDLKPENIMLIGEPTAQTVKVKIVDFGIALATSQTSHDSTGTGLGTQLYMAPEQIRNANAANAAADLYSVSKIFYELIVGVLPTGHWSPPSDGRSDVPKAIDKLIERGLSPNRDSRPQSAAEYREAMIAGFNSPDSKKSNANIFLPDPDSDLGKAREELKSAYGKMFRAMPKWVWVTLAVVTIIAIAMTEGSTY